MKKIVFLIMMFIVVLAGCGSSADTITIGMWEASDKEMEAVDQLVKEFKEETGIQVDVRLYTDYKTQLDTELKTGQAPDAFYVDTTVAPNMVADGALLPLNEYLTQEQIDAYFPEILASYMDDSNNIYALPKDWSAQVMFCNEDLLKSVGSSCSEVPTSFEGLQTFVKEKQNLLEDGKYMFTSQQQFSRVYPLMMAGGAEIMDGDTKTNLSDAKIIKNAEYYFNDFSKTDGVIFPSTVGLERPMEAFITGQTALILDGSWATGDVDSDAPDTNYTTLQIPSINGETYAPAYATGWGVNGSTEKVDQATQFVQFAATRGAVIMCENIGAIPANETVAQEIGAYDNPKYTPSLNVKDNAIPNVMGTIYSSLESEWNDQIPLVISGDATVEETFAAIDENISKKGDQFNA